MESWNDGTTVFLKDIIRFNYIVLTVMPLTHHSSIPNPIFPIFQHSNLPIGAKPLTCVPAKLEITPVGGIRFFL
jgi:hypothetical protein